MTVTVARPQSDEFAPFYAGYVAHVPTDADPVERLGAQLESLPGLLATVSESGAGHRYAPEKWSIKEVVGHLCDAERVFCYRLMRIARADATPLPGFDENEYVRAAGFDARPFGDLVAEWIAVRRATLALVKSVGADAWERRGVASGNPISARALLYIMPGHVEHHIEVLHERYGVGLTA